MPKWQRQYLGVCAAITGFALCYLLADFGRWPRLTYFPYEREWHFYSTPPGQIPMNYVGMLMWGGLGAIAGYLLLRATARFASRAISERLLWLAGAWSATACGLCGVYFLWNLWPF